jgi:hypothetical protein
MKIKFSLFFFFVLLASCQVKSDLEITPSGYSATATPPKQIEATMTNTVLKEMTPTPFPFTGAPSLVPTPFVTQTPIPTITTDELSVAVRNLMETNGNCDLPCWWGIIPGKSSATELRRLLTNLGVEYREQKTTQEPGMDTLFLFRGFNKLLPDLEIEFPFIGLKNDSVERLDVDLLRYSFGHVIDKEQQLEFKKIWSIYSLENVIRKYGNPDRILVNYNPGFPNYNLVIMYNTGISMDSYINLMWYITLINCAWLTCT